MNKPYVLGHSDRELDRLDLQGLIYQDITRRALLNSEVKPGMRVLDIGCGSGDVTRLAAEIVGPSGAVLGLDVDERAVLSARKRAAQWGFTNVAFKAAEATSFAGQANFDALVGRFVLMHQPSPAETLARASKAVRPGGVVMMLESHMAALLDGRHSFPKSDLYDRIVRWKCRVVAAAGADIEAGLALRQTFLSAMLPAPMMRLEAVVEGGPDSLIYRYMAESVRSMLPMAAAHKIDGFSLDEAALLEARLRDEVAGNRGVIVCWPVVSAWCRIPDGE
jgi:ubiquinone/menaquinone biosynthesis C-methylase UbiE